MSEILSRAEASAEWVAERLRDMIIKGDLAPGARIVERKISANMNVSRTPVREALKLLRADGLIEISMHRGAMVRQYTEKEALDLFDLISVIEGLAAERLAETLTRRVLQRLEDLHGRMLEQYDLRDATAYFDTNTEIHDMIVREAGNPILEESHRKVMVRARRGRFMAIIDADRWREAVEEHQAVMSAFRDGDARTAGTIWRTHLRHTGETVAEVLKQSDA
jgi:DNA-binding GntR family transcriptional regulator